MACFVHPKDQKPNTIDLLSHKSQKNKVLKAEWQGSGTCLQFCLKNDSNSSSVFQIVSD